MAQVIVDVSGSVMLANQQARQFFNIERRDIGRPFHDLEFSYRPIELRSLIDQAYSEQRTVIVKNVKRRLKNAEPRYFEVCVTPLQDNGTPIGVSILYDDVTDLQQLENEVQKARQDAETINAELQAANEELQSTNEERAVTARCPTVRLMCISRRVEGEWRKSFIDAEGLLRSQGQGLDQALWNAFRVLHENAALARRLADRARKNNQHSLVEKFATRTREAERQAELIRDLLLIGKINAGADLASD